MRVLAVRDAAEAGECAADLIVEAAPVTLGAATGSSPMSTYTELVRRGLPSLRRVCLLDEYVGLPAEHPARYRRVIAQAVAAPLGLGPQAVLGPDVDLPDQRLACEQFEAQLRGVGGVDVQVLGIGRNGHIGFNEPGSPFDSRTRLVELSATTRADNARFFGGLDEVPRTAITQGIATILDARRIVLIALGTAKARAVAAMLSGVLDTRVPASALCTHPDVTVIADRDALADSTRTGAA